MADQYGDPSHYRNRQNAPEPPEEEAMVVVPRKALQALWSFYQAYDAAESYASIDKVTFSLPSYQALEDMARGVDAWTDEIRQALGGNA